MDNQRKQIKGYRDLSQAEIDLMNEIKAAEESIGDLYRRIINAAEAGSDYQAVRWASVARTDLESGFMFLLKSVARPSNGLGRVK